MNFFERAKCLFSEKAWNMAIENAASDHVSKFLSGADLGGGGFSSSDEVALKYSAVYACFRVLAETFASVTIHEYKRIPNNKGELTDRELTDDTGLLSILKRRPTREMEIFNWYELGMNQLNSQGNFVCFRQQNRLREIKGLLPLNAANIELKINENTKRLEYLYIDENGEEKSYRKEQLFHVTGMSLNGYWGLNPLQFQNQAISLGLKQQTFSNKFFDNGIAPTGNFTMPGHLSKEAHSRLKKQIQEKSGTENAGKSLICEDGMTFDAITFKPIDAQLLESKKFQIAEISRSYRVPLHMLNDLDKATFNNIEHLSLNFAMYTMLPWFKRWEAPVNNQLVDDKFKKTHFFEFNMNSLLRGDQASMAKAFATGRQWGWLSINDIRRFLNMNSIGPEGDVYMQPLNMVPAGTLPKEVNGKTVENMMKLIEQMQVKETLNA